MKQLFLFAALTCASLVVLFNTQPASSNASPRSIPEPIGNYDIREDKTPTSVEKLRALRGPVRTDLLAMGRNVEPRLKIERNEVLGTAEIIAGHETQSLGISSSPSRSAALRNFVTDNRTIFGIDSVDQLRSVADYTNPDGNLSFAHFDQYIGDVPVFGAEVKAGFSRKGEMFRVINSLAAGLQVASLNADFGSVGSAIVDAAAHIDTAIDGAQLKDLTIQHTGKYRFSSPAISDEIIAERFYFPIGNGVARPAWRIALTGETFGYYVVVDAEDGTLLWRKNVMHNQSVSATYNVYGNNGSSMKTADSPSPFSPGCTSPTVCPQPPAVPRMTFTLVGNEAPNSFNNLGWIPDLGLDVRVPANPNITDGNNVEAGIDRMTPNGIDDNGWAFGNPTRVFNYTYNPAPGIPPPGEEPLPSGPQPYPPTPFQQGVITHAFYLTNRWHDELYKLGFTEQARNFQHYNFGRGGGEGDRVGFEVQDSSGTSGANHAVLADGTRSRMQMFIWTLATPARDGALDSQVVVHELTHGLTGRLHGNVTGLTSNMGRGMGEGWSDFYSIAMLSEPTDDPLGTHAEGAYVIYQLGSSEANYYYGIRRFPYAVWASRGPNGLPHNPLTFKYLNAGCDTFIGTTVMSISSAYPRNPVISTSGSSQACDQIHNLGEVWAVTLWEVRGQLIQRHGGAEGNRRALQYFMDGMKLSPLNPTVLQSRDAIITAAAISDAGDNAPVRRGFAIRGLGSSASIQNPGNGGNTTAVTEAFDIPVQFRRPTRSDFDGDGRSDVSVFRPSDGNWYLNRSTTGFAVVNWGLSTDDPVPHDFDGDAKADIAVFRPNAGDSPDYYILKSTDSTVSLLWWGTTGDIALTEDFDGDNKDDHAVYRPSTGQFWFRFTVDGSAGGPSRAMPPGVPIVGDWDGDGRGDFGTFSNGTWFIIHSGDGYAFGRIANWGLGSDRAVPADYDGDGKDDIAVYRPSDGTWYVMNSTGGTRITRWGISTDIPAPGDYDGDGRSDLAVYRDGVWYISNSTSGIVVTSFGLAGDAPLPASYIQ